MQSKGPAAHRRVVNRLNVEPYLSTKRVSMGQKGFLSATACICPIFFVM